MTRNEFVNYIHVGDFKQLFIECFWNNPTTSTPYVATVGGGRGATRPTASVSAPRADRVDVPVGADHRAARGESASDGILVFYETAQKKGYRVYVCRCDALPDSATRRLADAQLRKLSHDYLAIYVSTAEPFHHLWSVPVKTVDKRQLVTIEYDKDDQAAFLLEKLNAVTFDPSAEPTIVDVVEKVNAAFLVNTADVTKKFYQGFRKQHEAFVKGIVNVEGQGNREWYASVMLNRLMFCYFIQKKRFLNFDENYLGNKLKEVQGKKGKDKFYESFYRSFLKQLFSDGLDKPVAGRSDYFLKKYGRIPYLNGGMFSQHQIEKENKSIDIPDKVFESLFAFFDQWCWHLDNRITASGRDINPDVLGYIFEQYINDRAQMGAYYTKEDITEYIGRNCIVPYLIEALKKLDAKPFTKGGEVWSFLQSSGDAYIFPAVRKGVDIPLPDYIERGVAVGRDLRARRSRWNEKADEAYALPTEIWRETVARRQRCTEIRNKIAAGEITDIHDFITYNLDIRAFAEDVIRCTQDHKLVLHFYKILREVTILDPTCGSGAFLFAALNILEPLYEACLDRMEEWHARNASLFKDELAEIAGKFRSNRQYFIYKNIILRNLYGVDIMREATEIARLRLFLKMVAVVDVDEYDDNLGLDPLPDIDFNIRCGNTLVGYATEKEIQDGLTNGDMFAYAELKNKIDTEMEKVSMAYDFFRREQLNLVGDHQQLAEAKQQIRQRLAAIRNLLNDQLYDRHSGKKKQQWLDDTQPFHWYTEFHPIMHGRGGFDVIIGNPPYVEYAKKSRITGTAVSDLYAVKNYVTATTSNLYAFVLERSLCLSKDGSSIGMIVPISSASSPKFLPLIDLYSAKTLQWTSSYSNRPGKLFDGVEQRLTVIVSHRKNNPIREFYSADYQHWYADERVSLFERFGYRKCIVDLQMATLCKIGNPLSASIWRKLQAVATKKFGFTFDKDCSGGTYFHNAPTYFVRAMPYKPNSGKDMQESSHYKLIPALNNKRNGIACVLNSSVFYWFYKAISNCRDFSEREISPFPVGEIDYSLFDGVGEELKKSYQGTKVIKRRDYSGSVVYYEEYYPSKSKPIIDEIDELLAKHYGFTEEELDFIINYDIKYRMGDELNAE